MQDYNKMSHCMWECKYHLVFIPKYRKKILYGKLRKEIGQVLRKLCNEKKVEILEAHAMPDHVHMCVSIPPKYSVSGIVGYLKGKSAIRFHREYTISQNRFIGYHFWARGYFVSTVGLDEARVRNYIRNQEVNDRKADQLRLDLTL